MLTHDEQEALDLVEEHGGLRAAARATGIGYSTVQLRHARAKRKLDEAETAKWERSQDFSAPDLPQELRPVEDLLAERKEKFRQKAAAHEARRLVPITVNLDGPIGVVHFGDPHIDADGCDIVRLERHVKLVRDTRGLLACNVGDTTNNWTGRLARLYGEQSTSEAEAWQLCEWFVGQVRWLFLLLGNHDLWSGEGSPIKRMLSSQENAVHPSAVRVELRFPNGRKVRINARHDFKGLSQWNPAHGAMKAAQMGWRDHILTCGHKHQSGYGILKDPASGLVSHAIQVPGYKVMDNFARDKGFMDANISPAVVTVIDPEADETGRVQVFQSVGQGAEYLTWLRRKRGVK